MTHRNKLGLLLSTALTLPLAAPAFAQTIEINQDQLSQKTEECRSLGETVMEMEQPIQGVDPEEVVTAINQDVAEECTTLSDQLAQAGSATGGSNALVTGEPPVTDEATATDEATGEAEAEAQAEADTEVEAEAQLSETATAEENIDLGVEARAIASVPDPNVDVEVPGPTVRVTPAQPQVAIDQGAPELELEQGQPTVAVEIPEIVVRLQIPAPSIYMLRPEPNVQVTSGEPQVEVEQGEPTVQVTQADPDVNIALDDQVNAQGGEESGEGIPVNVQDAGGEGNEAVAEGAQAESNVNVTSGEPIVELVPSEGEPQIDLQMADPTVSYQQADPQVTLTMTEQPTIEIEQVGEPTVTIETPEERDQRRQGAQQQAAAGEQPVAETEANAQPIAGGEATAGGMTVGDLLGMEVVTADGEELGNPEAIVDMNGNLALVVSSGGFLGLGENETPVPLSNVRMVGEELVLQQLTEQQIEDSSNFEYNEEQALSEDTQVQLGE